jgi:hypothetical protein
MKKPSKKAKKVQHTPQMLAAIAMFTAVNPRTRDERAGAYFHAASHCGVSQSALRAAVPSGAVTDKDAILAAIGPDGIRIDDLIRSLPKLPEKSIRSAIGRMKAQKVIYSPRRGWYKRNT